MSSDSKRGPIPHLLIVDDDEAAGRLLAEVLEREAYQVTRAQSVPDAVLALERNGPFDAVLTDLRMPGASGLDLLKEVRARDPEALVLVLTAFGTAQAAGQAIPAGAYDFISKPFDNASLRLTLARALERRRLVSEIQAFRAQFGAPSPADEPSLVGNSPAMIEVMKTVARVAPTQATVLVT